MAFTENLDAFLTLKASGGLADPATLQGGAVDGVAVLFDRAYLEQFQVAGTRPAAVAKASAVLEADIGKTLTILGTVYTIKGREPVMDGAFVVLTLKV